MTSLPASHPQASASTRSTAAADGQTRIACAHTPQNQPSGVLASPPGTRSEICLKRGCAAHACTSTSWYSGTAAHVPALLCNVHAHAAVQDWSSASPPAVDQQSISALTGCLGIQLVPVVSTTDYPQGAAHPSASPHRVLQTRRVAIQHSSLSPRIRSAAQAAPSPLLPQEGAPCQRMSQLGVANAQLVVSVARPVGGPLPPALQHLGAVKHGLAQHLVHLRAGQTRDGGTDCACTV